MRPITRSLFRILNNEKLLPVQFLDLQFAGSAQASSIRLTDFGETLTWGQHSYLPVSMTRGGIEEMLSSEQGESPQSTLTLSNIDLQMAHLLNSVELNGAFATLWLADRRLLTRQRDAVLLAQGEVRDPQLTSAALVFQIVNLIGMSERITLPRRVWQSECNYAFGSRACGIALDREPYSIERSVLEGSTDRTLLLPDDLLSAAGQPADPTDYWANGYVLMQSGSLATQARPIDHVTPAGGQVRIQVRYPFYKPPQAGDRALVRRGCRKTKSDCKARSNLLSYGGFAEVPAQEFTPVEVKG